MQNGGCNMAGNNFRNFSMSRKNSYLADFEVCKIQNGGSMWYIKIHKICSIAVEINI